MRYSRVPEALSVRVEDELVILEPAEFQYFSLNPQAERIWELLDSGPMSDAELVATLLDEYDVDPGTCRREVAAFLSAAERSGLLVAVA